VLLVLILVGIGYRLIEDQRENIVLVIGLIDRVPDDIRALEEMCIERI
jgi:hypothetical protein